MISEIKLKRTTRRLETHNTAKQVVNKLPNKIRWNQQLHWNLATRPEKSMEAVEASILSVKKHNQSNTMTIQESPDDKFLG